MGGPPAGDRDLALVDELVRQITADAHSDDERLRAFRRAFEDHAGTPCDGFVIGEPVSVTAYQYRRERTPRADGKVSPSGRHRACRRGL